MPVKTCSLESPSFIIKLKAKLSIATSRFNNDIDLIQAIGNRLVDLIPGWRRFIKLRPHSHKEIIIYLKSRLRDKLKIIRGGEVFWTVLIDYLTDQGVIETDYDFALFWIDSRQVITPRSPYGIACELKQRGVDETIIKQALKDSGYSQIRALKTLYRRYQHKSWDKFVQAARRHGFEYQAIKQLRTLVREQT